MSHVFISRFGLKEHQDEFLEMLRHCCSAGTWLRLYGLGLDGGQPSLALLAIGE